jgi:hypothetical protein
VSPCVRALRLLRVRVALGPLMALGFLHWSGLTEGNIAMAEIIGGVPLSGWILAILVTVLSVASSLTQMAPEHTVAAANISAHHVGL